METNKGSSRATIQEEKPKTREQYFNEASKLYSESHLHVNECMGAIREPLHFYFAYATDDDENLRAKVNRSLELLKKFEDALGILHAKECIDSATALGRKASAQSLQADIQGLFDVVVGPVFQFCKVKALGQRADLVCSLQELGLGAEGERKRVIDRLLASFPRKEKCILETVSEAINFDKQFSKTPGAVDQSLALDISTLRSREENRAFNMIIEEQNTRIADIAGHAYCRFVPVSISSSKVAQEIARNLIREDVVQCIDLLESTVSACREAEQFIELLLDQQTSRAGLSPEEAQLEVETTESKYSQSLDHLAFHQGILAYWQSAHLTMLGLGGVSKKSREKIKETVSHIDAVVKTLTSRIIRCYPHIAAPDPDDVVPSGRERLIELAVLAKSYDFLAGECYRLSERFPKRHSEIFVKIGDALSGAGECISKTLNREEPRISPPESESLDFLQKLFGIERAVEGEESVQVADDRAARLPANRNNRESGAGRHVVTTGLHVSSSSAVNAEEPRTLTRLVQEVEDHKAEKQRQERGIEDEIDNLEKIEKKLKESEEEVGSIKAAVMESRADLSLSLRLKSVPQKAMKHAELARRKAVNIVGRLETLEDFSISKGAVSEEGHRSRISEYAAKANEYEERRKQLESDANVLQVTDIKISLGSEVVRKSNAAKRWLTELIELPQGVEELNVTACKTLPYCPPARNKFGILEMNDKGEQLYDHVVEYRVELKNVPEFVLHFHFRHPLQTVKSPEHYVEKMEIHDWNVQAPQKQEMEEKVRSRQLVGGQKVVVAINEAWKETLKVRKEKQKEVAVDRSATPAASSKKGRRRRG